MMPCSQDRKTLAAYLDGEVQAEQGNALSSTFGPAQMCGGNCGAW